MNHRIRQLAAQAGFYVDDAGKVWGDPAYDITNQSHKLVELIVRECADITDKIDSIRSESFHLKDGSKIVTGNVLKQHFGIEE